MEHILDAKIRRMVEPFLKQEQSSFRKGQGVPQMPCLQVIK